MRTYNIIETYVEKYDPWSGISAAEDFSICSTANMLKGFSTGKFLFGHNMILPIKHKVDWELIRRKKQMQINKDNIRKNNKIVNRDYKVRDKLILNNHTA